MRKGDCDIPKIKFCYTDDYLCSKLMIDLIYHVICALISIFILRWNWLWYPVAFVVSDILENILYSIFSCCWYKYYWKKMSLSDQLEKAKLMLTTLRKLSPNSELMYDLNYEAKHFLSDFIECLEEAVENEQKNPESKNIEVDAYIQELENFEKSIEILKTGDNTAFLKSLINKLNKVIDLVAEKPSTTVFANKIFNIYLPETIVLIKNLPREEDQQIDYKENLINVCKEIDSLTDATIKTIFNFNQ